MKRRRPERLLKLSLAKPKEISENFVVVRISEPNQRRVCCFHSLAYLESKNSNIETV